MIFPDWGESAQTAAADTALPLYTEYAVDWDAGGLVLRDGKPVTVTGTAALRVWVYLALHPQSARFACTAHSNDYGNELAGLLGEGGDRGILESRARQYIREALLVSPYIRAVEGFSFTWDGACLTAAFTVRTVYEDFLERVEVVV